MPGMLDDPTFMAALGGGAQPPGGMPQPGMPAAMPPGAGAAAGGAGIPPALAALLKAALMGQVSGGGGLPPGGAVAQMGAAGAPGMAGEIPGSMAAAGGAMGGGPNSEAIAAIMRMNKNRGTTPDPGDPGYVRAMKSLLSKGLISQEKYDALINDPHQYTPGGEDGWQGSPRQLSDY